MSETVIVPPEKSFIDRLRNATALLAEKWKSATAVQQQRVMLGGLFVLLVAGFLGYWTFRPNWKTLYSGLAPEDSRQIALLLTTAGIQYDISTDGSTLRVASDSLDKARLATAAKAAGKTGRSGFEIFDKPNWAGSDFDEKVNYQRALEGELEHTIEALADVQSARVHLVLPHDAIFLDQQREAKASVMLKLKLNRLSDEQADSIRNLLASAVDDLKPDHVVLVDANGHSPLSNRNSAADAKAAYEESLADHVIETLEPIAGEGNVRATASADYDSSSTDEIDEKYDPTAVVALSMQRSEQISAQQPSAAGVPGTSSNAPNQQPLPLFPNKSAGADDSKEESGTYGASKKTLHLVQGPGKLRRINVAVVVNDRMMAPASKKSAARLEPWTSEELKQFAALAQAAVGYDATRGDQVVVQNLRFHALAGDAPGLMGSLGSAKALVEPALKYATILALAAILLSFGLRPILKGQLSGDAAMSADRALPAGSGSKLAMGESKHSPQLLFEQVADHVQRDPAQSARILQSWIKAEQV